MDNITVGQVLTGSVKNVVDFGAFVDIGVGKNGLIHKSKMRNCQLKTTNQVEVVVDSLDLAKGKIGLALKRIL